MAFDLYPGATVHARGEQWRVARVDPFERCSILTLDGRDRANRGHRVRLIAPFDRPVHISRGGWRRRRRRTVMRAAVSAIADARPSPGLWRAADAAIDLHAYQLEPALAVLRGATRVLLADAVGLGKTIQAGLILSELRERGWVERALIVCPAGLRDSWAAELAARFGIGCKVFGQASIADAVSSLPPGINPWSTEAAIVVSMDFIKRPDVLAAVSAVPIDLLIADEAHHLTPGTDRGAAIDRLASRTPWCVFMSATPHSGDQAAFDYLTGLGRHRDPIVIFRRGRGEAGLSSSRRTRMFAVRASVEDRALLDGVERYARAIWDGRGRLEHAAQLLAITLARRAASSPCAIERTLTRRLALLGQVAEPAQPGLPWDEEDSADGLADAGVLSTCGFEDESEERAALEDLIARSRRCGAGAKIRRLVRLIERISEPAIVFTEYRDTVDAVLAALPPSAKAASIHGGLTADERQRAVASFNGGGVHILVATDAAGEGLNLHHRCRLVIDMELPWNPLRLEQRIGRVDRIGQRRRVHAVSLYHPGSIEDRVLRHLRLRQQRAGLDVRFCRAGDIDVARVVFDGACAPPSVAPAIETATVTAAADERRRLGLVRALKRHALPRVDRPMWAPPRPHRGGSIVALRRTTAINAHGTVVCEDVDAWRVDVRSAGRRCDWRELIAAVAARCPAAAVVRSDRRARRQLMERIASIRARVASDSRREHQRSLFDRRADAAAAREAAAGETFRAALDRRAAAVSDVVSPGDVRADLVAVWPLRSR